MTENNKPFEYRYSAREQTEIKKIRDKYSEPDKKEPTDIEKLRSLDAGVTKKANAVSIALGTVGTLILGTGMSLAMTDFSEILGSWRYFAMPFGIALGLAGIAFICAAYPVYKAVVKKERRRIAPEIIRLTNELLK